MNNGIFVQNLRLNNPNANMPNSLLGIGSVVGTPLSFLINPNMEVSNSTNLILVYDTRFTFDRSSFGTVQSPSTIAYVPTVVSSAQRAIINWGDGSFDIYTNLNRIQHTYPSFGAYIIQISGSLGGFGSSSNLPDNRSLVRVLSFGNIGITSLGYAFFEAVNLEEVPSTIPIGINSLTRCFWRASKFNGVGVKSWQTSSVTDMRQIFDSAISFNQDIGSWEVISVTDMSSAFTSALSFNNGGSDSINNWNTGNVTNMSSMFSAARSFNQPLNNWNVRKVGTFASMFRDVTSFNSSLSGWAPGADNPTGTTCSDMFRGATSFNQYIGNWDTIKVYNMNHMFNGCTSFNQPIDLWNTQSVGQTESMFLNASSFNSTLNLNTASVTNMGNMFSGASAFNQSINSWNTANVTNMGNMFVNAISFNQPLNNWNVRKVTSFAGMFTNAINFNSGLDNWQLGLDTAGTSCNSMFLGAQLFNQNLTSWNVSKVNNMGSMFACIGIPGGFTPSAFQGDISNWNLAGLNSSTSLDNFMLGKNLTSIYSTANYDALLIGWNNNKLVGANGVANWRTDLRPNFGGAKYTAGGAAADARAALVSYGWTITDGGTA